jgi:hypothetical protein
MDRLQTRVRQEELITLREASVPSGPRLSACSIRCGYLVLDVGKAHGGPIKFGFREIHLGLKRALPGMAGGDAA